MNTHGRAYRHQSAVPGCVFCDPDRLPEHPLMSGEDGYGLFRVFEPLNPVTPGHTLVVPCYHVEDATERPGVTAAAAFVAAEVAAEHEAYNLITSGGEAATQTIRHLHWHVVPRRPGDGLHLPWTNQPPPPEG